MGDGLRVVGSPALNGDWGRGEVQGLKPIYPPGARGLPHLVYGGTGGNGGRASALTPEHRTCLGKGTPQDPYGLNLTA